MHWLCQNAADILEITQIYLILCYSGLLLPGEHACQCVPDTPSIHWEGVEERVWRRGGVGERGGGCGREGEEKGEVQEREVEGGEGMRDVTLGRYMHV